MEFFSLSAGDKFPSEAVFVNVYGALESIALAYVAYGWPVRQTGPVFVDLLRRPGIDS